MYCVCLPPASGAPGGRPKPPPAQLQGLPARQCGPAGRTGQGSPPHPSVSHLLNSCPSFLSCPCPDPWLCPFLCPFLYPFLYPWLPPSPSSQLHARKEREPLGPPVGLPGLLQQEESRLAGLLLLVEGAELVYRLEVVVDLGGSEIFNWKEFAK